SAGAVRGATGPHPRQAGRRPDHGGLARAAPAHLALTGDTGMSDTRLPPGVSGIHVLPADHHDGPWDSIITPPGVKERLLGTAVLVLRHGRKLQQLSGAPHGLVVLSGPPGTGKSTLCQG